MKLQKPNEQNIGIASAIGAHLLWGILPVYWKLVNCVPALEILAHRIVWCFVFLVLVLLATGKISSFLDELRELVSNLKKLFGIIIASLFISVNWLTYIWAVNTNHVIDTSLGYYINPLVSVLLGIIVLKEKLSFWQMVSFFLAMIGVLNMTFQFGAVPWISLILAASFGLYGLCKKMINLGEVTGITLETLAVSPLALLYLAYVYNNGGGAFGLANPGISGLLAGAGIMTALPLLLFASSTRRLPLSVVGFIQYISPTISLLLGVFLYHEPFTSSHLVSFIFIWTALTVFSLSRTKTLIQLESLLLKKIAFKERT